MARRICAKCRKDLGPSDTDEDSHGYCEACAAALLNMPVEDVRELVGEPRCGEVGE